MFYFHAFIPEDIFEIFVRYEWKKNGLVLNVDRTASTLEIKSRDEGYYQCFARNQFGTALSGMTHVQRNFLDHPFGYPTTFQKTIQEGQPFHIQGDPRNSFPKPTYGWELATDTVDQNPVPLKPSKRIQIAENGRSNLVVVLFLFIDSLTL